MTEQEIELAIKKAKILDEVIRVSKRKSDLSYEQYQRYASLAALDIDENIDYYHREIEFYKNQCRAYTHIYDIATQNLDNKEFIEKHYKDEKSFLDNYKNR